MDFLQKLGLAGSILIAVFFWLRSRYYKGIVDHKLKLESEKTVDKILTEAKQNVESSNLHDLINKSNSRYRTKTNPHEDQ